MTYDILGDSTAGEWPKIFWFICIAFDGYTALLGLTNIKLGGGLFAFKIKNMLEVTNYLTVEDLGVLVIGAALIVSSPMFAFGY